MTTNRFEQNTIRRRTGVNLAERFRRFVELFDKTLFDEDCRRFMARQSNLGPVGVHGGEDDVRRDSDGNPLVGGRPTAVQTQTTNEGKSIRERLEEFVQSQGCFCPTVNWRHESNRVFGR